MPGDEKRGALSQSEEDKFAVLAMLRKSHSHAMRLCIGHLVMQGSAAQHVAAWLSFSQVSASRLPFVTYHANPRRHLTRAPPHIFC